MSKADNNRKSYYYALFTIILWSTVATAFKIALNDLDILNLLLIANLTAIISTLAILVISGKFRNIFNHGIIYHSRSLFLGFLNPYVYYLVLFKAYSLLPAQIAQPLNFTWPVVLTVMSVFLLGQRVSARSIAGIIISFAGVIFISSQGNLKIIKINNPSGVLLALISAFIWSFYWIISVKDKRDEEVKIFLNFLCSGIYIIITCIVMSDFNLMLTKGFYAAIYAGLFEMGITFIIWIKALQLSKSTAKTANLIYITPFLSLVFIHFILKEEIFITSIIGLILIVLGILIQRFRQLY
jgi:drug/metabolite transporter (DMT)-like permease